MGLALSLFLLSPGCGSRSQGRTSIDPTGDFRDLEEDEPAWQRCDTSGQGCGRVVAAGNLVQGSFRFEDLFVTCAATERGYVVTLRNASTETPTFQLRVSLYGISAPEAVHVCKGVEPDPSGSGFKTGSCEVNVVVHRAVLSATQRTPCLVQFDGRAAALRGSVRCEQLELAGRYVSIESGSVFECQR